MNTQENYLTCSKCGESKTASCFPLARARASGYYSWCKACVRRRNREIGKRNNAKTKELYGELRRASVREAGGKCSHCDFDRYMAALEFHHVGNKEANVGVLMQRAARGNSKYLALLQKEISKCILLCSNCHRGLHAGEWRVEDVS